MFEKQGWHFFFLALLLVGVVFIAQGDVLSGQLWGISTQAWLWIAVAVPVIHQIFVWLFWRLELHHGLIAKWFGESGFPIYKVGSFQLQHIVVPPGFDVCSRSSPVDSRDLYDVFRCPLFRHGSRLRYRSLRPRIS